MTEPQTIPRGLCQCGCGGKTRLARQTRTECGQVKGEPLRYIDRHQNAHNSTKGRTSGTPEERFHARYERNADGCWVWHGTRDSFGYGRFSVNGRSTPAHRFSYELLVGPIPAGLVIDHLCRNPSCVNPAHLEPVTNEENIRRGKLATLRRDQVLEIRRAVDELCWKYGVGPQAIADIGKRYTWASVPEDHSGPGPYLTVKRQYKRSGKYRQR